MIKTITLIRKHDSEKLSVAIGPERPRRVHRQFVKDLRARRSHPEIAEVFVCRPVRRFRLERSSVEPKPQPASAPVQAVVEATKKTAKRVRKTASKLFGQRIGAAQA